MRISPVQVRGMDRKSHEHNESLRHMHSATSAHEAQIASSVPTQAISNVISPRDAALLAIELCTANFLKVCRLRLQE